MKNLGKNSKPVPRTFGRRDSSSKTDDKDKIVFRKISSEELKKRRIDVYPYLI